jgi:hypothetical protein
MKKRRRIEFATFRCRTSIVLRDKPEAGHVDAEVSHPLCADPVRAAKINLGKLTSRTPPAAAGLGLIRNRQNDQK